jgi:RNA polymerase sigma-32 factor
MHELPPGPACGLSQQEPKTVAVPTLSAAAERALCRRWRDRHDSAAVDQLVGGYMPMVGGIAAAYGLRYRAADDDLVGACYVGLMRAICRFDPDRGEDFPVYVACRVHAAVQEFILSNWFRQKLGSHAALQELLGELRHLHAYLGKVEFHSQLGTS